MHGVDTGVGIGAGLQVVDEVVRHGDGLVAEAHDAGDAAGGADRGAVLAFEVEPDEQIAREQRLDDVAPLAAPVFPDLDLRQVDLVVLALQVRFRLHLPAAWSTRDTRSRPLPSRFFRGHQQGGGVSLDQSCRLFHADHFGRRVAAGGQAGQPARIVAGLGGEREHPVVFEHPARYVA